MLESRAAVTQWTLAMRLALVVFCLCFGPASNAQPANKPATQTATQDLVADTHESGLLTMRPIPDTPLPQFTDPVATEDNRRVEAISQEFSAAAQKQLVPPDPKDPQAMAKYVATMQDFGKNFNANFVKFIHDRADAAVREYGERDPRAIAALENAGLALISRDPQAASLMDKAIQLRELEVPQSAAYLKDLDRRCRIEAIQGFRNLSPCEHAYQVRAQQNDASAQISALPDGERSKQSKIT